MEKKNPETVSEPPNLLSGLSSLPSRYSLNPEQQVLLFCAGVESGPSRDISLQEKLSRVADWRYLLQAALDHGIFPSLGHRLAQVEAGIIPPGILQEIFDLVRLSSQRTMRITGELLRLLALLEEQGVTALPYKGPVLAQMAYGDITRRQFVDLDFLVRRTDIPKAKSLLLSLGYLLDHSYTAKQEEFHLRHTCEFSFYHPQKTLLDVHWRFAADYLGGGPDVDRAFARRVPVSLLGNTVYTLSPQDYLLVLCHHGAFHLWSRLSLISDLAHLLQVQTEWDWDNLLGEAQADRMRRLLLLGLSLAHEVVGVPVPPHVMAMAAEDRTVVKLRHQVLGSLFAWTGDDPDLLHGSLFQWETRERLRDKLVYVVNRAFLPTVHDWRWMSLPDSRFWLYYLLRPWRLFAQCVLGSIRHRGSQKE